jgi:uncharacterized protein
VLPFENVVRDPVHGDIPLTREELGLLDTPEMQRLRHVRQLGAAYLVYPGAQHSRFEHSIGTAHLTSRMVREINAVRDREGGGRYGGFDQHELRIVRLAALVHDSTHLPFGHNIEDQTGLLPRHDNAERFEAMLGDDTGLGRALAATGVRNEVLAILAPSNSPRAAEVPGYWRGLVSGTIDADMLDYLARDAMFTGLHLGYDPRIFNMFRVDRRTQQLYVDLSRKGYLKEALLSEILRCLEARYYFSERVYYHHAKIAAGALVAKAVEIALLEGAVTFEQLQRSTDAGLIDMLERSKISDSGSAARLRIYVDALNSRKIPKRAAVYPVYANQEAQEGLINRFFGAGTAEARREVEEQLGAELKAATGQDVPVLLYCPAAKMQLKQARMLVRWPGEAALAPLSEFAQHVPRLADLEQSYQRMWKFYVLALTRDEDVLSKLGEIAAAHFPETTNVLTPRRSGPGSLILGETL